MVNNHFPESSKANFFLQLVVLALAALAAAEPEAEAKAEPKAAAEPYYGYGGYGLGGYGGYRSYGYGGLYRGYKIVNKRTRSGLSDYLAIYGKIPGIFYGQRRTVRHQFLCRKPA